ncbi:unnamed protein product [Spirodela intermedia]|uniref:Autophagy-related protein 13 N-terminal domain-containing protein n=1 Tax=Spirodela intermedia TaxID=51605 RepID=A0A7I8L616_SPIIN|nr:unnamed protein product [Spirodela intermedia]
MASPQRNAHSEAPMVEQIITEFFAKSLHIILGSRYQCASSRNCCSGDPSTSSPSSSSSTSSVRPRDKWFNLALGDCPAALENMDLWGVGESNFAPLVIDVILVRRPSDLDQTHRPPGGCLVRNISAKDRYPNCWSLEQDEPGTERREKIIERWVVQYESRNSGGCAGMTEPSSGGRGRTTSGSSHSSEMSAAQRKVYKRSIILLRSLYLTVRLLPAYKIFRDLVSTGQVLPFSLAHRISSFVEPFTRVEDEEMQQYTFSPIDTPCGRLCLSVSYLPTLENLSSEPWTPLSAQLISDYVGSPLADPLKRFECLPSAVPIPTYVSFTRRHSWSNSHRSTPSASPSPSPTRSCTRTSSQQANPELPLPGWRASGSSLPKGLIIPHRAASLVHNKGISFDEQDRSPSSLPSSSASPPYLPARVSLNALLRTESAPERVPLPQRNSCLSNDALPPLPSPRGARPHCHYWADNVRAQEHAPSSSQPSPPDGRFQAKPESLQGESQPGVIIQKVPSQGATNSGNLLGGLMAACTSPRLLPNTSNTIRLSMLDEFVNSGFLCPFVEDDDFRADPPEEREPTDHLDFGGLLPVRKSQGAAVGELVIMLKHAPPLHQDPHKLESPPPQPQDEPHSRGRAMVVEKNLESPTAAAPPSLLRSRTTSDALEELKNYREMKDLLLQQGGPCLSTTIVRKSPTSS